VVIVVMIKQCHTNNKKLFAYSNVKLMF